MKRMLLDDYWRGKDSTGIAAIRTSGEVKIAKMGSHAIHLMETPKFNVALDGLASCAFLGHNRAATRGSVNDYNAHPYQVDHIVGAHNGTLWQSSHDDLERKLEEKFPVDSLAIIAAIAAFGIEETVPMLEGAYALTWVNLKEGTINFLRNKDRPLHFAIHSNQFIYWASEWETIQASLRGAGRRELNTNKEGVEFFQFPEDMHYKYKIGEFVAGNNQKPVVRKLEGKKYVPFTGGVHSNIGRHNQSSDVFRRTNSTTNSASNEPAFIETVGTKDDPYAGHLSKSDFEVVAASGCQFCGKQIAYGDTGIVVFKEECIVTCPEHSNVTEDKVRIYVDNLPLAA